MKKIAQYKVLINSKIEWALERGNKTTIIRPISKVGSGNYSSYGVDHTKEYTKYLDSLNIKYNLGNDAPKGGQLGNYIEIKIDKRNAFIKQLIAKAA